MKFVLMNGGLGNQVFQYVFFRWLEIKTGESCIIDNSAFCVKKPEHNGFELKRLFGVQARLLSDCFDEDVWNDMMLKYEAGTGMCQQLQDAGLSVAMVAETDDFKFAGNVIYTPVHEYNPYLAITQGNIYFHGYWIQNCWFNEVREILQDELRFPVPTDVRNVSYARDILNTESVCMHVRRGDFVALNRAMPWEFYAEAVHSLEIRKMNLRYFVFSDDLIWCKENLKRLGLNNKSVELIQGNKGRNAYIDVWLMSLCRHMIMDNSSFVYLAALLRKQNDGIIIKAKNSKWNI